MSLRHLPNMLCLLRIALVYPVAHWIMQGRFADVMLLFAIAASTDALDGFLAKRFGWQSVLGGIAHDDDARLAATLGHRRHA